MGEGGTQASRPARPGQSPRPARRSPRSAQRLRKQKASRGGQPLPRSREMPQPRLLARRPGPAARAPGTHLRLRRPGRPGRAPGRCVRLRPLRRVPIAPVVSRQGPKQRRERRRQREQPTSGAAHPELLTDPRPPPRPRLPRLPRRLCATVLASATAAAAAVASGPSAISRLTLDSSAKANSALGLQWLYRRVTGVNNCRAQFRAILVPVPQNDV